VVYFNTLLPVEAFLGEINRDAHIHVVLTCLPTSPIYSLH
jgi:hypothetical protein